MNLILRMTTLTSAAMLIVATARAENPTQRPESDGGEAPSVTPLHLSEQRSAEQTTGGEHRNPPMARRSDVNEQDSESDGGRTLDQLLQPADFGSENLSVYGYIQPSFIWTENTDAFEANSADRFTFGNARVGFKAKYPVHEKLTVGAVAEINLSGGSVRPVGVFATLGFLDDVIRLDFGQQRVSYSMYRHTSARFQQLVHPTGDQPDAYRFQGRREPGVRIRAEIPFADQGLFRWYASVSNGDGTNSFANEDSQFNYATFIDIAPLGDPGWAPTDLDDSDFTFSVGGSAGYNPSVGPTNPEFLAEGSERRFAGHGRMKVRGFSLRGEYFHIRQTPEAGDDVLFRGGMVQAGYVLPWLDFPQIEVAARYHRFNLNDSLTGFEALGTPLLEDSQFDALDFESMKTQIFEFGLNLYLLDHRAKIGITYRITDVIDNSYDYQPIDGGVPVVDSQGAPVFQTESFPEKLVGNRIFVTMQIGAF